MVVAVTDQIAAVLAADRSELAAASTSERVAGILRTRIMEGLFAPGSRLSEEVLGRALGVSRNTLREAFRLLCHERLTVHEMNRGIFVSVLTKADVVDLYRLRRMLEGDAARLAADAPMALRKAVISTVDDGEAAAARGDWLEVRTADLHFHQAIERAGSEPARRRDYAPRPGRTTAGVPRHYGPREVPCAVPRAQPGDRRARAFGAGGRGGEGAVHLPRGCRTAAAGGLWPSRHGHAGLGYRPHRARRPGPRVLRFLPAGPSALLVQLDGQDEVFSLAAEIDRRRREGWANTLVDVVPGASTVLLDGVARPERLAAEMATWSLPSLPAGPLVTVEISCRYDGPDLADVATHWGVAEAEVVEIHTSLSHRVAFCGFSPGFAYIDGLGQRWQAPRRPAPRASLRAGSVGLAGTYTGIYPRPSPGGWQIIGYTNAALWDPGRDPPALLAPGTAVRFVAE